ncbi:Gfo/Idh/MocA family protein [Salisediminibacterium halotolerans]|uniref:Gfo/Idh/MocA family protein n=1 Tax=Salisediminibacterium halotolerans TaxID=517425 RepID=UPI000EAF54AF|nr:Gfo/Idh/MocA family oxidoreductase [Salisediminibacterium halotolerans]RLJ73154.1 virulence factor [Actinophytocola xinjiangensis]RPE86576.1 virulence factor [Salisediminibacterium halotolerans]TWG33951.1 virulence factor [Salisediminibacterium halotolerans]GEL06640.1 dehydrogenase [Salisediminibacterium halotolerans]
MIKVGMIGIGDVAKKAYLPLLGERSDTEVHLYTRDQAKLKQIGRQYRFTHLHESLSSLIASGIEAAFVHSTTHAHEEPVRRLLEAGVHVFVDKPVTMYYDQTESLTDLADRQNLLLVTGFNRRFAPSYQRLKDIQEPNMVIVQKNRSSVPLDIRTFVVEDFIHVVDSMRFLFPYPITNMSVDSHYKDDLLHHVILRFSSPQGSAVGIMNRNAGTTVEKAEVMGPHETGIVQHVKDLTIRREREEIKPEIADWVPTLKTRGFTDMVDDFIEAVNSGKPPAVTNADALETHRICEYVVTEVERQSRGSIY